MQATTRFRTFHLAPLAFGVLAALMIAVFASPSTASANHSWGGYHWARTANPFNVKLGNNLTSSWQPYLRTTSSDWNQSSVLSTTIVAGSTTRSRCNPTAGRDQVCNYTYGNNGWLGLAQIWLDSGGHISQGTVKVNDTYFNQAQYNNSAEKNHVMCQEVGHTFGLDHQDTSGASLGTCMDYSQSVNSQHPNQHDYDELVTIYSHTDSYNSSFLVSRGGVSQAAAGQSAEWGVQVKSSADGRTSTYVRDLGQGRVLITHVYWAK